MNDWMMLGFNWMVRSVLLLTVICTFVFLLQRRWPLAASSLLSVGVWGLLFLPVVKCLTLGIELRPCHSTLWNGSSHSIRLKSIQSGFQLGLCFYGFFRCGAERRPRAS